MTFIRSLLFEVYFFASICFFALMCALFSFLTYPKRFFFARVWGQSMLSVGRWLCGLRYQVEGEENIPDHASVILIKHSSVFETYAQLAIFPPQTWVVKRELLWIPLFGWGLAAMKPIAIKRGAGRKAVTQVIRQGKQRLAEGIWITVFPEGTRMPPGKTRKYGISGAALAREAGVNILPVAHNAGDFWARRSIKKSPGLIRFVIGPPIDASTQSPEETNVIVQSWIEKTMAEISPAPYSAKERAAERLTESD